MRTIQKIQVLSAFFLFLLTLTGVSYAYVPEPQSEGKFFESKGTAASAEYESRAGAPVYDYGKGIQWGPLHLTPTFDYDYTWTDNIFFEANNEKSDYVNRLAGELLAELPLGGGQHLLSGSYRLTQEYFSRFGAQDHTDHRGTVGLDLNFVPFTLNLEDTYEQTVSRADTEFTDRIKRDENAFHSLLEVPFASIFFEQEITDFDVSYSRNVDAVFDHNIFTTYQRVGYDLGPQTQLLGEYTFINIAYDQQTLGDRDGDGHQYMIGLRGKFTERLVYQAWTGAQHRIYDDSVRPDFNGVVARGAVQWDPNELNRVILKADRTPQESTFDNQSYYTRNRVELSWRRQIAERWFWESSGSVGYHEYSRITTIPSLFQDFTRRDTLWDAGTGVEYLMPNDIVSIVLNYHFVSRDSSFSALDYDANEVSAGVRARF